MHILMNYIGCIGSLMADTGMQEVLEKVFGSVLKVLTGKKCPQCARALRLLVEELLHPILRDERMDFHDMLQEYLTKVTGKIRTQKFGLVYL